MQQDIASRTDIESLMTDFYAVAITDNEIGHHFETIDLAGHLPVIVDFWEKALFGRPVYFGNPLLVHQQLHAKSRLTTRHFDRWLEIFVATVDRLFTGEVADKAKNQAHIIAKNLDQRLNQDPWV